MALAKTELHSRAYTPEQIKLVATHQIERNALATEIAWRAGLRAHELLTVQRAGDASASGHRNWSPGRFMGRDGVSYVVTGKGGLRREVVVPRELSARLEARRLDVPLTIRDRGISYRQHYGISGGNAWSKSFSEASARALGWSAGAHGCATAMLRSACWNYRGAG